MRSPIGASGSLKHGAGRTSGPAASNSGGAVEQGDEADERGERLDARSLSPVLCGPVRGRAHGMGTVTPIKAIDEVIVPFPPTEVWRVLADIAAYPSWWPRHLGLRVLHHEPGLVGSEVEERPFGGRPFRCRVEAVEEPFSIRTRYYGGFIEGRGEFRLESSGLRNAGALRARRACRGSRCGVPEPDTSAGSYTFAPDAQRVPAT